MTTAAPPRPPADPREAPSAPLTVERYVQLLYPRLAWEATLRLGDPSTAGRLVERVLHRAWRERDRFAAGDALMRHASESAEAAIAREEGRRLAVTRFDAEEAAVGLPGDLSPLSTHAVAERLRSGRSPMPTPPSSVAIPPREAATAGDGAAVPVASPPAGEELHTREHHRPGRASWATPHAAPATASPAVTAAGATADSGTTATASHRTSTHPTGRPHLRSASYIARPARRLSPRMLGLGIGGVLVAVVALWRLTAGPSGAEAARAAAADSTAPSLSTGRAERRDTTLREGLTVGLGPSSSVTTPTALSQGIRGVRVAGVVSLDAAVDSARPLVVRAGPQVLELAGGRVNVVTDGDTVLVFLESGEALHRGATATRIASGQSVRIAPDGGIEGLDAATATRRFAWRSGRLVTPKLPLRELRGVLGTWYGMELVTDVQDSLALDVPLDSTEAVMIAVRGIPGVTAALDAGRLTVTRARPPAAQPRRQAAPVVADVELPPLRRLPGVPDIPPA